MSVMTRLVLSAVVVAECFGVPLAFAQDPAVTPSVRRGVIPVRHAATPSSSPALAPSTTYTYQTSPVTAPAGGATVIASVQAQGVYLGPSFATTNAATVTQLEGYLSYLTQSSYMSMLGVYGVGKGSTTTGKVITGALPHYTSRNHVYLTDAALQNILVTNIKSGVLAAPNASTVYVVYTEPGVAIKASDGSTSINYFLGYHDFATFTGANGQSQSFAYAIMPYPGSPNPSASSQGYASVFDELTDVTSHELAEATTDPNPNVGNGWTELITETDVTRNSRGRITSTQTYQYYEEIADVPPMLSANYQVRLNGYLVQKIMAKDGQTLMSPAGSTSPASLTTFLAVPVLRAVDQGLQAAGLSTLSP